MRTRVFLKFVLAFFAVILAATVLLGFLVSRQFEQGYSETLRQGLEEKARLVAGRLAAAAPADREAPGNLETLVRDIARQANARVTLIRADGTVLADSEADPAAMENHARRPEFVAALHGKVGSSTRFSATVHISFLYLAIPLASGPWQGGALRLAYPLAELDRKLAGIRRRIVIGSSLAILAAMLLAAALAASVSRRLHRVVEFAGAVAKGNLTARMAVDGHDEISMVMTALNQTADRLEESFSRLADDVTALERLENVRKDFVANVSHELRTPLTSIQGYAETLLESGLLPDARAREFVEIIRKHAVRMAKLTADLLTLSRIELGRHEFRFAPLQAADAVEWAIESVRQVAQARGVALTAESVPEQACVMADSDAIHQVLLNLLDNALKYTPAGGRVTVSARPTKGVMEFCVSDTGAGIAAEHLPRLFERFYRVDKARSRELGGTGLGLSIVKHIARAHGGDVRVESEAGRGSSFYFTLPLAPAAAPVEVA
ncbi:MAG TPA: ATP-binding protein [Bryobacterales bacterium]|nr:ATP-binding protein [Bryobacterales bacterium]